jgi:hypothetical protein
LNTTTKIGNNAITGAAERSGLGRILAYVLAIIIVVLVILLFINYFICTDFFT